MAAGLGLEGLRETLFDFYWSGSPYGELEKLLVSLHASLPFENLSFILFECQPPIACDPIKSSTPHFNGTFGYLNRVST